MTDGTTSGFSFNKNSSHQNVRSVLAQKLSSIFPSYYKKRQIISINDPHTFQKGINLVHCSAKQNSGFRGRNPCPEGLYMQGKWSGPTFLVSTYPKANLGMVMKAILNTCHV
jgi:hypothetical protein